MTHEAAKERLMEIAKGRPSMLNTFDAVTPLSAYNNIIMEIDGVKVEAKSYEQGFMMLLEKMTGVQ